MSGAGRARNGSRPACTQVFRCRILQWLGGGADSRLQLSSYSHRVVEVVVTGGNAFAAIRHAASSLTFER
jgi:hypothetical protein